MRSPQPARVIMPPMTREKSYPELQAWLRGLVDVRKTETRDSIAAAGGIHPSNVSHWLRTGGRPGMGTALRIASHVGVSGIDVLEWCGYKEEAEALRAELVRHGATPEKAHDCQGALGLGSLPPIDDTDIQVLHAHHWINRHGLSDQLNLLIRSFLLSVAITTEGKDDPQITAAEVWDRFPG